MFCCVCFSVTQRTSLSSLTLVFLVCTEKFFSRKQKKTRMRQQQPAVWSCLLGSEQSLYLFFDEELFLSVWRPTFFVCHCLHCKLLCCRSSRKSIWIWAVLVSVTRAMATAANFQSQVCTLCYTDIHLLNRTLYTKWLG